MLYTGKPKEELEVRERLSKLGSRAQRVPSQ